MHMYAHVPPPPCPHPALAVASAFGCRVSASDPDAVSHQGVPTSKKGGGRSSVGLWHARVAGARDEDGAGDGGDGERRRRRPRTQTSQGSQDNELVRRGGGTPESRAQRMSKFQVGSPRSGSPARLAAAPTLDKLTTPVHVVHGRIRRGSGSAARALRRSLATTPAALA
jgi:hypothetical protein